jgi:two-component system phosphate regulon sensor histidine kinase PhoR
MIKPKKLIWQIFPVSVLTILVAIVAVSWYGAVTLQEFYFQETENDLEARASLVSERVLQLLKQQSIAELRDYSIRMGRDSGTRITVIRKDGKVLADSSENPELMDNHRMRREIDIAFAGSVGKSRRYSKTLGENRIYVALPLVDRLNSPQTEGMPVSYVIRTSVSVASLARTLENIRIRIIGVSLAVMIFAGVVTLLVSRNVSKPLEQMTESARQFSLGDFSKKMLPLSTKSASLEIVTLAGSMDRMAKLLDEKIQAILTHGNQLETILSSMVEAVIVIDTSEQVIRLNESAALLFGVNRKTVPGKFVQQLVRNVRLQQKITRTLATREADLDEVVAYNSSVGERFLQTNIVSLSDGQGAYVGVLVVMNDVTRMRKLEEVRRDFVANVSHELKTPITSIHGYVETLLDGALDNRDDARKFLKIILKQSGRLSAIIEDLLSLSRIEQQSRKKEITYKQTALYPVIRQAIETCQVKADTAGVSLEVDCPEDLTLRINSTLVEQAVVNLVVNAITYSGRGDMVKITVTASVAETSGTVRITVEDQGCGIAAKHLPRLFERFYRSDQARSRSLGGTGLGLAIVKHIAQAHRGTVEVESSLGSGSTFTLVLHDDQLAQNKNSLKNL